MVRQQFEATEGLLEDVMRKQAGSVEKAVLEAVMNSVDANAESIEIVITEESITISDDGDGMEQWEVEEYFKKFGLKDDDIEDKDFGKFRIGRGQIFNFGENIWHSKDNLMVVNLDHDYSFIQKDYFGDLDEEEIDGHEGSNVVLETKGLSYNLLPAAEEMEGCSIQVNLYEDIDDPESVVSEVTKLTRYISWVHDVTIRIKSQDSEFEEIWNEPDVDFETDLAWYVVDRDSYGSKTQIYNQGAFVKTEQITKTPGEIISKIDLDVNFARNDILDTDQYFKRITEDYEECTANVLIDSDNLTNLREKIWLLERGTQFKDVYSRIRGMPLLEDVSGESLSVNDLDGETITHADPQNKQAEYINRNEDVVVLSDRFEGSIDDLVEAERLVPYDEAIEEETRWEMDPYNYEDLSKRRRKNFDRAEWFLEQVGFDGDIRPGYSMHVNAWKTDEDVLFIEKSFLNQPKTEFIIEGLMEVLEVASQSGDTRHGLRHGFSFKDNFWNYAQKMGEYQIQLLGGNVP